MSSRPEPRRRRRAAGLLLASALACTGPRGAVAAPQAVVAAGVPVSSASAADAAAVNAAIAELRADPQGGVRTERQLRWRPQEREPAPVDPGWLFRLGAWVAEASRWVMWGLGALAVAWLLVFGWRWWRVRAADPAAAAAQRPSHVNDLDIRPASLPDDIGAAARDLLRGGHARAALSLLYRGTLSRLVHVHRVPIRAASTEGECARLARAALPAAASDYVDALVQAGQQEVYAGRPNAAATIEDLCTRFGPALDPAPEVHAGQGVAA